MAKIELIDESPLNVTLSEPQAMDTNVNEQDSVNVTSTDGWYEIPYNETDPIFSESVASTITNENIENWNNKSDFSGDYDDLENKPDIPTKTSQLTNDSGFLTEHQDISGKVDKVNGKGLSTNDFTDTYKSNVDSNTTARHTHSNKSVLDDISSSDVSNWDNKQETLVSGTNIKTINNESILGSGNITIQGGSGGDAEWGSIGGTLTDQTDLVTALNERAKIFYVDTNTTTYTYNQINELINNDYEIKLKTDMYMGEGYGFTICNMIYCSENGMYFSFVDYGLTGTLYYSFNDNTWEYDDDTFALMSSIAHYGGSSSTADSQNKTVTCYDLAFELEQNAVIFVKFTYGNTYDGTITLNVNGTGAKDVAVVGSNKTSRYYWSPGEVVGFVYDGTNFVMLGKGTASTTYYGVTKLSSSTSSTSEELAATPKAVKTVADSIPTKTSDLTNDSGFITSYTETDPVFTNSVAHGITSTDITNWNNKSTFSGSYNDLTNKPTIPDELSDLSDDSTHRLVTDTEKSTWNAKSDFSGSYTDLTDKPTIPSVGNAKTWYGTCSTGANTQKKIVTCSEFALETGATIFVEFTNGNTYNGTAILNVNSTGDKTIYSVSSSNTSRYFWKSGEVVGFVYDGTNFVMIEKASASTTYYGITKLSSSTSSTSEALAATPKAVKAAYDLADGKQDALVSGTNIKTINSTSLLGSGDISVSTFSGSYNDLSNKPSIPSKTSDLTNDSGYITSSSLNDKTAVTGYMTSQISSTTYDIADQLERTGSTNDLLLETTLIAHRDGNNDFDTLDNVIDSKQNAITSTNKLDYSLIDNVPTIPTVPTKLSSFTDDLGNSPTHTHNQYLTSHQDISGKQDTLVSGTNIKTINSQSLLGSGDISIVNNKDIITVTRTTDFTINQSDAYVAIPFDSSESIGSGLTLNNGGVVIGSGISKVKISSKICLPSSGMTAGSKNLVVRKNGNVVDRAWQYLDVKNSSMSTPVRMISVSEGDVLTLAYYGKQNDKIAGSSVFTDFTVEAVEYE